MDDALSKKSSVRESNHDDFSGTSNAGSDRWLVSYADFMTLLMAFFVVMYSLSQVSDDHFRVLGEALDKAFNSDQLEDPTINEGVPQLSYTATPIDLEGNALEDRRGNDSNVVPENFVRVDDAKEESFEKLIEKEPLPIMGNERWSQIELSSEVLFASGGVILNESAKEHLTSIAGNLKQHGKEIRVEGFTDNQQVTSAFFPSNWELSAARAAAVVRYLVEQGVEPDRLSAVGYGEHYPIATNSTEQGRRDNRRIVLSVAAHDTERPESPRRADVLRARKRLYPYELRSNLPEGVKVFGLEEDPKQAADAWLNARLGSRKFEPAALSGAQVSDDVVSYQSNDLGVQASAGNDVQEGREVSNLEPTAASQVDSSL